MKRLTAATLFSWLALTGIGMAQPLPEASGKSDVLAPVKSVAAPAWNEAEPVPPPPVAPRSGADARRPAGRAVARFAGR